MKRLTVGMIAHVDCGKTTLSESLLYNAGEILKIGRVDHQNAFLDTDKIEKDRGITIFSKQAMLHCKDSEYSLLDTPGHVDFSAEAERTLRVLDYAILLISAADGVQSHGETLWKLLAHYDVPTFIFINKTDLIQPQKRGELIKELKEKFSPGCIDFSEKDEKFFEESAITDETLLEKYISNGYIDDFDIKNAIAARKIFPCFFGSALKNEGVGEFLEQFDYYTNEKMFYKEFGAKIFKIAEDENKQRLVYMKITGGSLKVKSIIENKKQTGKINEIRIYSGAKYKSVNEVYAGNVCAVTGLSNAEAGDGLGKETEFKNLVSEPVFNYSVRPCKNTDIYAALEALNRLAEQETQLRVRYSEQTKKIDICVMGEIALEVIKRMLCEKYNVFVEFEKGSILYKETIENTVEGVGHYEPLRHYAEVHLLLEPAAAGSGLVFSSKCAEDVLSKNWQRLIMTHLEEKNHVGVLTGSPITDMKITLISGRAHIKHTDGGDFRQATYRAVRQGLMQAKSVLLEPYYDFKFELPTECVGRAMTDLKMRFAQFAPPSIKEEMSCIEGSAPVDTIQDYHSEVAAYTHGRGRFNVSFKGYDVCHNADEVISRIGYISENDTENTANSVFCSHGSGHIVRWDEVFDNMHIPLRGFHNKQDDLQPQTFEYKKMIASEEELLRIFEMTYGKIKQKSIKPMRSVKEEKKQKIKPIVKKEEYLLIDGYNIIFAWEDLKQTAKDDLHAARELLINKIANYRAMKQNNVILVFDAYRVPGDRREIEKIHDVSVVYTKEAETADSYIEKTSKQLCKNYKVRVATSDNLEQIIIFGHGAVRVSANEFYKEVCETEKSMREFIEKYN